MKLRTDPVVGSFNSSINVNMLFFKTNPCCALAASLVDEGSKIPTDGLGEPSPISGVGGYGG